MAKSIIKNPRKVHAGPSTDPSLENRIYYLENNEYKITYYEIVSGASGSLTIPTNSTINEGEFGSSGNAILSEIDVNQKPTFKSPQTAGGVFVTASLNATTGAWLASGVYTSTNVALIYSISILAVDYQNIDVDFIVESEELDYDIATQAAVDTGTANDQIVTPKTFANSSQLAAKASLTGVETLTNKTIVQRVTTIVSSATPTINTDDCDAVDITALAAAITSMTTNLSGTPTNFQKLIIRIKDNGTARAITWGAAFANKGGVLPTTTVIGKLVTIGLIYNTTTSLWECVAVSQEV